MENFKKILSSFYIQDKLNPTIWLNPENVSESKMNSEVRDSLLAISDEFIEFLGLEIFVSDITMTG